MKGDIQICTISSRTSHQSNTLYPVRFLVSQIVQNEPLLLSAVWFVVIRQIQREGNGVTISGRVLSHSISGRFDVFSWSYSCSIRFLVVKDIELSNSLRLIWKWQLKLHKNPATTKTTTSEPRKGLASRQPDFKSRLIRSFTTRQQSVVTILGTIWSHAPRQYSKWFGVLLDELLRDFMSHFEGGWSTPCCQGCELQRDGI